jgi:leucyl-tRNA synthetase
MEYHADPAAFAAHAAALKERGIEGIEERKDGDVASIILRTRRDGHGAGLPDDLIEKRQGKVFVKDTDLEITGRAEKMSKSRGNVINPDDIVKEYGADALRLYEMFMGPLTQVKVENDGRRGGVRPFSRLYRSWLTTRPASFAETVRRGTTRDQLGALHAASESRRRHRTRPYTTPPFTR